MNEISIFRNFGSKEGILREIFACRLSIIGGKMKRQGKIKVENTELAAITFVSMNFGFFIMKNTFGDRLTSITPEEYIQTSIRSFLEGMLP